uniref:ARAD1D27896p n=1 Tax=Blastobotrys adeninivorans TaxID=409370 RepID=A0A060TB14_BLAAD
MSSTQLLSGLKFRFKQEGDPSAPLLVLSNSLMSTLESWDYVAPKFLDSGFQLLRYDQVGHGETEAPARGTMFSMDDMVRQLHDLLAVQGVKPYAIIGCSIGGIIALRYAQVYPEDLTKVVASSVPGMSTLPNTIDTWNERIAIVENGGLKDELVPATINRWFKLPEKGTISPQVRADATAQASKTSETGYLSCVNALLNYDFDPDLPKIKKKPLLIAGQLDGNLEDVIGEFAKKIPDSQFVVLPNSGHIPMVDDPERFASTVLKYLKE